MKNSNKNNTRKSFQSVAAFSLALLIMASNVQSTVSAFDFDYNYKNPFGWFWNNHDDDDDDDDDDDKKNNSKKNDDDDDDDDDKKNNGKKNDDDDDDDDDKKNNGKKCCFANKMKKNVTFLCTLLKNALNYSILSVY